MLALSVNVIDGVRYLAIGGDFITSIGGIKYENMALYNLDDSSWVPVVFAGLVPSNVLDVLLNNTGSIYSPVLEGISQVFISTILLMEAAFPLEI